MTASGRIPMVGLPEMRRGSLTLVTRPSTVAPTGISVLPLTTTACVTFAWKGSPTRLLKVARVVSRRTMRAVPAGTGALVCAVTGAVTGFGACVVVWFGVWFVTEDAGKSVSVATG